MSSLEIGTPETRPTLSDRVLQEVVEGYRTADDADAKNDLMSGIARYYSPETLARLRAMLGLGEAK